MDNRTNTIAGWVLAGGIAALGLSIVSGMVFENERPHKMGYPIEGVDAPDGEGAAVVPLATLLAGADLAKGADAFKKCTTCHTVNNGGASTSSGPNLWAVVGKPHGAKPDFAYSDALKGVAGNWDFEGLDAWLTSPRKYAPGTKMTFAGLANPQERANLIAYLNSQGSNLPLPAAPATAEPAEANATMESGPGNLSNEATPAAGAPSRDPAAAEKSAGH